MGSSVRPPESQLRYVTRSGTSNVIEIVSPSLKPGAELSGSLAVTATMRGAANDPNVPVTGSSEEVLAASEVPPADIGYGATKEEIRKHAIKSPPAPLDESVIEPPSSATFIGDDPPGAIVEDEDDASHAAVAEEAETVEEAGVEARVETEDGEAKDDVDEGLAVITCDYV